MRRNFNNLFCLPRFLQRLKVYFSARRSGRLWPSVFGWSVSAAWLMLIGSICWVAVSNRQDAVEIIMALAETAPLWGVALGIMGIAFMKGKPRRPTQNSLKRKNNDKQK